MSESITTTTTTTATMVTSVTTTTTTTTTKAAVPTTDNTTTSTKQTFRNQQKMFANDPTRFWSAWSDRQCEQHNTKNGCNCFEGMGSVM